MPDGSALLTDTGNNSSLKSQGIDYIVSQSTSKVVNVFNVLNTLRRSGGGQTQETSLVFSPHFQLCIVLYFLMVTRCEENSCSRC